MIGEGEVETGQLAVAWHSNKFLGPVNDGAVLTILHLNGYKIDNSALPARIEGDDLVYYLEGCGWSPRFVKGHDPANVYQRMAEVMHFVDTDIRHIQADAKAGKTSHCPRLPIIVVRSPNGRIGPGEVDGVAIARTPRSHKFPLLVNAQLPEHVGMLERWMQSYRPEELFDAKGTPFAEIAAPAPVGDHRMGGSSHANGGVLLRHLRLPDYRNYAVNVPSAGAFAVSDMGRWVVIFAMSLR